MEVAEVSFVLGLLVGLIGGLNIARFFDENN